MAIVAFERKIDTAEDIATVSRRYEPSTSSTYHGDVFADHWGEYDCFVGLMASGIAMRKTAGLLDDKWEDPAVVVVDEELTWAIPLTGGHHGANQVAHDLSKLGAVPAMTTASEAAGKQGVESRPRRWTLTWSTATRPWRRTSPCWTTNSALSSASTGRRPCWSTTT